MEKNLKKNICVYWMTLLYTWNIENQLYLNQKNLKNPSFYILGRNKTAKLQSPLIIFFLMWTIFKVFTEFITILLFYVLVFWLWGTWYLSPWPGIESAPPALEGEVLATGPSGKSRLVHLLVTLQILWKLSFFLNLFQKQWANYICE